MKDRVHGTGFSYECQVGCHEYERRIRQRVLVDFEAETDWRQAPCAGDRELVDYQEIYEGIREMVARVEYRFLEDLAEDVARFICTRYPVVRVRTKVTKTPFDMPGARAVAVECWRAPEDFAGGAGPRGAPGGAP